MSLSDQYRWRPGAPSVEDELRDHELLSLAHDAVDDDVIDDGPFPTEWNPAPDEDVEHMRDCTCAECWDGYMQERADLRNDDRE